MRVPLHAPSDRSAVFHFITSLTDIHAPLHAPSDRSADLTLLLLWQTCAPLCKPCQISLPYFTPSLLWLAFTPFSCSCCRLTPFLIFRWLWHCLCSALMAPVLVPAMIQTRHYTNPPWYKLKASYCKEGIPKRFCKDDNMVWIFYRCKTETRKFMCGLLPGKRIVCSASKVTTCSSVYQTCQVVVNGMLHQQGDNTVIMYQSCHATATVKQDDSHYK